MFVSFLSSSVSTCVHVPVSAATFITIWLLSLLLPLRSSLTSYTCCSNLIAIIIRIITIIVPIIILYYYS
jgi:hypothetical protein